jgi:hypothetical protein
MFPEDEDANEKVTLTILKKDAWQNGSPPTKLRTS